MPSVAHSLGHNESTNVATWEWSYLCPTKLGLQRRHPSRKRETFYRFTEEQTTVTSKTVVPKCEITQVFKLSKPSWDRPCEKHVPAWFVKIMNIHATVTGHPCCGGTFQFQHSKPVPTAIPTPTVFFRQQSSCSCADQQLDPQHGPRSGRQSKGHNSETESLDQNDPRGISPSTLVRSFAARQVRATVKTHGVLGAAPTSSSTAQPVRPKHGLTPAR